MRNVNYLRNSYCDGKNGLPEGIARRKQTMVNPDFVSDPFIISHKSQQGFGKLALFSKFIQ